MRLLNIDAEISDCWGELQAQTKKMNYFPEQDIIYLAITDEEETESMEISPNITVELNANGELIGVEILKASTFL